MHVASARDGAGRLFVVEKAGGIKVHRGGRVTTYLDLAGRVNTDGEAGLLSITSHPRFRTSPYFCILRLT